jgi:hypothetical protein
MPNPETAKAQDQPAEEFRPMLLSQAWKRGCSAMVPHTSGATKAPRLMPMYSMVKAPSRRGSSLV